MTILPDRDKLTEMSLQAAHAQSHVLIGFLDGESKMRSTNRSMARHIGSAV